MIAFYVSEFNFVLDNILGSYIWTYYI